MFSVRRPWGALARGSHLSNGERLSGKSKPQTRPLLLLPFSSRVGGRVSVPLARSCPLPAPAPASIASPPGAVLTFIWLPVRCQSPPRPISHGVRACLRGGASVISGAGMRSTPIDTFYLDIYCVNDARDLSLALSIGAPTP